MEWLTNELAKQREEGAIDYDKLCSKDEYLELFESVKLNSTRNDE